MLTSKINNLKQYSVKESLNNKIVPSKEKSSIDQTRSLDVFQSTSKIKEKMTKYSLQEKFPSKNQVPDKLTTKISEIRKTGEVELTKANTGGFVFVVFLPFINDENSKPIRQPILMSVKETQFEEFGFDIPFQDFFDEPSNIFEVVLGQYTLQGCIIASGATPLDLRSCLQKCCELNNDWKQCLKMIGKSDFRMKLIHKPLTSINCVAKITKMKLKDLLRICDQMESKLIEIERAKSVEPEKSNFSPLKENSTTNPGYISKRSNVSVNGTILKDEVIRKVSGKIELIQKQKELLNRLDLNSFILSDLIEITVDLASLVISHDSDARVYCIDSNDNTYKIKKKDRIFIEGLVQFELSKYTLALNRSKRKNPFSLAYQLVKLCFPEQYFLNVSLGKKYYEKNIIDEINQLGDDYKDKIPLSVVWGYKDPLDEPKRGEFDFIRGQERVKALIEHILRKCDIYQYDEELEYKIRSRLTKELSSKNKVYHKNIEKMDCEADEEDDGSNNVLTERSSIWNSDCFDYLENGDD